MKMMVSTFMVSFQIDLLKSLGVILSAVIHTELGRNPYLLILDSKTMHEIGRAEFEEVQFPKDLHGIFVTQC